MPNDLAASLESARELAVGRGLLDERLRARGEDELASALEELYARAREGSTRARAASVVVASWLAHLARGASDAPRRLHDAAERRGLELTRALLREGPAQASLPKRGRLREIGVSARRPFRVPHATSYVSEDSRRKLVAPRPLTSDDLFPQTSRLPAPPAAAMRFYFGTRGFDDLLHHPDAVMIGRLLDERWIRLRDVLLIATRKPTVPAIASAIATRDRWMGQGRVREALGANPFTPSALVLSLLPSLARRTTIALAQNGAPHVRAAARLFLTPADATLGAASNA